MPLESQIRRDIDEGDSKWYDQWSALINIHFLTDLSAESFSKKGLGRVREILSEALSNAYRHGKAENFWVDGAIKDGIFEFRLSDDGIGFTEHKKGFGSDLFTKLTNNHWKLERIGDRTVLSGTVALD